MNHHPSVAVVENGSVNNILALNNLSSTSDALIDEGEIELEVLKHNTTHNTFQ